MVKKTTGLKAPSTCFLSLILLAICLLSVSSQAFASENRPDDSLREPKQVVVLNSHEYGMPWQEVINQSIETAFENDSSIATKRYAEFTGLSHNFDEPYVTKLVDLYRHKYAGRRTDLVITVDLPATGFIITFREELFPDVPVVFITDIQEDLLFDFRDRMTGITTEMDVKGTLDLALQLHPGTKRVAVISGASELDRFLNAHVWDVLQGYETRFEFINLAALPLVDLLAEMARLPEDTIVLYGLTFMDGGGKQFVPKKILPQISSVSNAPLYSFSDTLLGSGIVGGHLSSVDMLGVNAAKIGLRILKGEAPGDIPVLHGAYAFGFDYQQLKRFNISEAALPDDSIVINKPYSFYAENKRLVWGALIIFLVLTAFIVALSLNVLSRRRTERELERHRNQLAALVEEQTADLTEKNNALADSENRYRSLSDAAFEGVVFAEEGKVLDANHAYADMFGYELQDMIGMDSTDFVDPDRREEVRKMILSEDEKLYEMTGVKKDGTRFPIEVQAKMFFYKGRRVRVTAIRDLSKQKKAEEEIKTLRGILPICSSCKKIRDDKGYWNQIESYIKDHSDATFSHSLCKECAKRLYPDYDLSD
jgi:PAS domain S-box-containing protein